MKKLFLLLALCLLLTGCVRTSLVIIDGKKGGLGMDGRVIKKTSMSDKAKDVKTITIITIEGENVKVEENSELTGEAISTDAKK